MLAACLTLLGVAARSASSISGERDRQTLDGLLCTPLESDEILYGKWLGGVLCVHWGWVWLGLIWGIGLGLGGLHPVALPLLIICWFVYAAFLSSLGLWFSIRCRTTLRATVATFLTAVLASVGHWLLWFCCLPLRMGGGSGLFTLMELQAGITPPAVFFLLSFPSESVDYWRGTGEMLGYCLVGTLLWAGAAAWLWGVTRLRFIAVTGREESSRPPRPPLGFPAEPETETET
jgi:ABC-type Na+ efflux pump permease subunit